MQRIVFTARMQRCSTFKASFRPALGEIIVPEQPHARDVCGRSDSRETSQLSTQHTIRDCTNVNNDAYFAPPLEIGSTENNARRGDCMAWDLRNAIDSALIARRQLLCSRTWWTRPKCLLHPSRQRLFAHRCRGTVSGAKSCLVGEYLVQLAYRMRLMFSASH